MITKHGDKIVCWTLILNTFRYVHSKYLQQNGFSGDTKWLSCLVDFYVDILEKCAL